MSQWGAIYPAVQNFKNTEQYLIKECIKNCLIVMPFNKILIIFYIFGALYGVGDRVSRVIVYQKKKNTGNDYLSWKTYEDYTI